MKLTTNPTSTTSNQLSEQFKGITPPLRNLLFACKELQLTGRETDRELLSILDEMFARNEVVLKLQEEQRNLKYSLAVLTVDKLISEGICEPSQRLTYIQLGVDNLETTKAIIYNRHQTQKQLSPLLQLSWNELWKADKLEELKKLSFPLFKDKFRDQFKKEYTGK